MLPLVLAMSLLFQVPRQRLPPQQGGLREAPQAAVATFDGVFKIADKKYVTVAVENNQTMRLYLTGKTQFFREGKPAKVSDFQNGDPITIDAERDARMNMLAVRIELAKQSPPR